MTMPFSERDIADQSGRTFVVIGVSAGLGFQVTRLLAKRGSRVLMPCRDAAKAGAAVEQIRADTSAADVALVALDPADLVSVRLAVRYPDAEHRLDVPLDHQHYKPPRSPSRSASQRPAGMS